MARGTHLLAGHDLSYRIDQHPTLLTGPPAFKILDLAGILEENALRHFIADAHKNKFAPTSQGQQIRLQME